MAEVHDFWVVVVEVVSADKIVKISAAMLVTSALVKLTLLDSTDISGGLSVPAVIFTDTSIESSCVTVEIVSLVEVGVL